MSVKLTIALATAALIGLAMAPVDAFARGGHGGHGGGMHVGHVGHIGHFHGFRGARFGFYPGFYGYYNYYPYGYDDGCYLRRRVVGTPWGPRVRLVRVCYY